MVMRTESSLRLENDSEPHGEGWWKWSAWVSGSPDDLAGLESVTYRLHPSSPEPVVQVTDRSTNFKLSSTGWGEFAISADAKMKDGRTIRLERWLALGPTSRDEPNVAKRRPSVFLSHSVADSEIVDALSNALTKQGVDVRTAGQSVEAGGDFASQIDKQLQEADAVVALVSEPASRWVEQEALRAHGERALRLPVVVVAHTCTANCRSLHASSCRTRQPWSTSRTRSPRA